MGSLDLHCLALLARALALAMDRLSWPWLAFPALLMRARPLRGLGFIKDVLHCLVLLASALAMAMAFLVLHCLRWH